MKNVSAWASRHPWPTRFIIVLLIYPLLNLTGWALGMMLLENGFQLNVLGIYLLCIAAFFIMAFYPRTRERHRYQNFYVSRKIGDGLLALTTFLLITWTGNVSGNNRVATAPLHASEQSIKKNVSIEKPSTKEKKTFKKFLKDLRKKYKDASKGGKVGLIVLTIVVALILIYLLAALSCSIACGGAEALAWIVAIFGLGGIIFGTVKVIQRITRGPKKVTTPEMPSS
ncbi:MAG: hypothetical protein ACXWB9_06970 [Flavisolibacter sp.]